MKSPRYWLAGTLTAVCLAVAANAQIVSQVVNTVAVGGITGLGTGVATALGIAVGTAGGPVTNGGVLGTPSSGTATNLSGTAASLTAGSVTTNANLTGAVTSVGNATTMNSASTALTDFVGTTWTPTDQSGASLTFTGVSGKYLRLGGWVFVNAQLTYPSTANGNATSISLPVTVPNVNYAKGCNIIFAGTATAYYVQPTINTATFQIYTSTAAAVTNLQMSTLQLNFQCIYPDA